MSRSVLVTTLALLALSGCSFHDRVDAILELAADAAAGEAIYAAQCLSCHAADGRGSATVPDLIAELHHGDKQILTWILDGKGEDMPAFPSLTDQEAADVLAHLHALAE